MPFQNSRNYNRVYFAHTLFLREIMINHLYSIFTVRALHLNYLVESAGTKQRIRQAPFVIRSRKYKDFRIFTGINTCLDSYIFFRIRMLVVLIGKFIQIIKKNNRSSFSLCFIKYITNCIYHLPVRFFFSDDECFTSAFFNKAFCHQRLSQSRFAPQHNTSWRLYT